MLFMFTAASTLISLVAATVSNMPSSVGVSEPSLSIKESRLGISSTFKDVCLTLAKMDERDFRVEIQFSRRAKLLNLFYFPHIELKFFIT